MQIILLESIERCELGDVVKSSKDGYARNYLIPHSASGDQNSDG